jgi:choline dehydrogenase
VKTLQTFLAASAFDGFVGSPVTNLTTDAQIEAYVRAAAVTIKHCVSTAKISKANETGGVVGPYLQVKGVDGVRVVDASIFVRPQSHRARLLLTSVLALCRRGISSG